MQLRILRTVAALATLSACSFDPSGGSADPDSVDGDGDDGDIGDDGDGDGSGEVGGDAEDPPPPLSSCAAYLADDDATPSAVYTIDPGDGGPAFEAHCEMELEGGGWTLALKADGRTDRFQWSAPYWTTTALHAADAPDLDHTEAKLDSFNRLPFTQVLVVFETPIGSGDRGWVYFDESADSLLQVFSRGSATPVSAGRDTWLDAIPDAELENDCEQEGFNVGPSQSRVRLGVVGAKGDEDECDADKDAISKLGIGGSLSDCNDCVECDGEAQPSLAGPTVGNHSGCAAIPSFATVYVR